MQFIDIVRRRLAPTVVLALLALAALGVGSAGAAGASGGAKAEQFVPGVTDFPSRLGETGERAAEARVAGISEQAPVDEFVPGVTDFPSRLGEIGEQAAERRLAQATQQPVLIQESGFDWSAGATGAFAAAFVLLGAALAIRTARRSRLALG